MLEKDEDINYSMHTCIRIDTKHDLSRIFKALLAIRDYLQNNKYEGNCTKM